MRSRITRPDDNDNNKIKIKISDDEQEQHEHTQLKSKLSNRVLQSDDMHIADTIMHRHAHIQNTDPFGRNDIFSVMIERTSANAWPEIKSVVGINDMDDYKKRQYQSISDRLVKEYYAEMVRRSEFLPVSILKTLPLIDIHSLFGLSRTSKDNISWLPMNFNDREIYDIRNIGWKSLLPYFPEQVIRVNGYRYIYVKILESDKKKQNMKLHFETYIGTDETWVCRTKTNISFQFEENGNTTACSINTSDTTLYEQIMSKGLKYMKTWTKKEKALWQDMFCVPASPSDLILVRLHDTGDIDGGDTLPDATLFLLNPREQNTLYRIFGRACTVLTGKAEKDEVNAIAKMTYAAQYVNTMATIFIKLRDDCTENKDEDGWLCQDYSGMTVRSETPIQKKEV